MKKLILGYIFSGKRLSDDEKIFLKLAKRKNVDIVIFNASKDLDEKMLAEKASKCDLVYNSSAEEFSLEFAKTLEGLGAKVIDPSKAFYYSEDKWMFFVKSSGHGIPVPETILLSPDENIVKGELRKFNHWPVVLKRVSGCQGEFVERAKNEKEAIELIEKFYKKGNERLPIIAQEFIKSPSYRVLVIGNKIAQAVQKKSTGWKATGAWASRHKRFKPDKKLKEIVKKTVKIAGINICGIDLVKKNNEWAVLEVNSEPTFGFIECDREKLIGKTLDFFRNYAKE